MNSPKLAFACIPFALLAPVVAGGHAPRANDAVVIAVDAFGRPVPGLELEVVLRGKDGALTRTTEKPSAKTGKARVKVGDKALADVNVKGDFDVAAQTSWKEGDTRHVLLTVVPLIPFEVRLTNRDGTPQKDVAVIFECLDWRQGSTLFADGQDTNSHAFVSDAEGVVRGKAPRNADRLSVIVPGSFAFVPDQSVPVEGYAASANAPPLDPRGHVFHLYAPNYTTGPLSWIAPDESPLTDVRWCAFEPQLVQNEDYLRRFSVAADANGLTLAVEPVDFEGDLDRSFNELAYIRSGEQSYLMSVPPVDSDGLVGTLAAEDVRVPAPKAPADFAWAWRARGDLDVRQRVDAHETPELRRGFNSLWAAHVDDGALEHLVRIDARVSGAIDTPFEFELFDTVVDIASLPKGRWAIESTTVLVDEDDAYLDVNDSVALDAKGRAKTFGTLSAEYSQLYAFGPGLASGSMSFEAREDGTLVHEQGLSTLDFEFVRADGSAAPYVCFEVRTRDPESVRGGSETRASWSDEEGRATVVVSFEEGFGCEVQFLGHETLLATLFDVKVEPNEPVRVVVPETGRLEIDGVKLVGGDPRPLLVRFAPFIEGDERSFSDRDGVTREMLTSADGTLVIDDVPVGAYTFEVSEPTFMSPNLGGFHRVDVTAPKAKR